MYTKPLIKLHIAYGEVTAGSIKLMLKKYRLHNKKDTTDIVTFLEDDLSTGSLRKVDTRPNTTQRFPSLYKFFSEEEDQYISSVLINDLHKLLSLDDDGSEVIIWYGYNAAELSMVQRVAWYLRNYNVTFSEVIVPKIHPNDSGPDVTYQVTVGMLNKSDLWKAYLLKSYISSSTKTSLSNAWEEMLCTPDGIRILTNNNIVSFPATYYDNILLNQLNNEWRSAAFIIGNTIGNSYTNIGYRWLIWRLRYMANIGQLELRHLEGMQNRPLSSILLRLGSIPYSDLCY